MNRWKIARKRFIAESLSRPLERVNRKSLPLELSNTGLPDSRTIDLHDGLVLSAFLDGVVSDSIEPEEELVTRGTIAISDNVKNREPSHIQVTGSNGAKDTEYRCAIDESGNGTIIL